MAKVRENWLLAIFKKLAETEKDIDEKINTPKYEESSFLSELRKETASSIQSEKEEWEAYEVYWTRWQNKI